MASAAAEGAAAAVGVSVCGTSPDTAGAATARHPMEETEGSQGTKTAAQTQALEREDMHPPATAASHLSSNTGSVRSSSGTGQDPRGSSPFLDLTNMAKHLLSIHLMELPKGSITQHHCETGGNCAHVSGTSEELVPPTAVTSPCAISTIKEIVFGESHLQQVLLQSFGSTQQLYPLGCLGRQQKAPGEAASSAALWGAGECKAQLDCNGDVLSLSLSSNAHLIALSRGVLLSFQRLRVLLLPLNGLRNFDAPGESPAATEAPVSPTAAVLGDLNQNNTIELPQLRVLDLSFNELCTLDGFWATPRLQQLCLVANHLLLLSDLAPVGTAAPQLRQLWLAGNPLHMGTHSSQQLQQLLPALELLDGRPLQITPGGDPLACPLKSSSVSSHSQVDAPVPPPAPHCECAEGSPSALQQHVSTENEPRSWAIAAAAQVSSIDESQGQRYCSCYCDALTPRTVVLPEAATQASASSKAEKYTSGCGGLCSVAAAIRTARISGWRPSNSPKCYLPHSQYQRLPNAGARGVLKEALVGVPELAWSNWRERVDVLEMSFLRLRDAPNIHTLVGLRKLELSENKITSIQGLLGLRHLEELLLDGNSIESLEGIEALCHLECLDISHNCIVSFPPGMQHLSRLVFLCAESNKLQQLEHLEGLPALTQLYLSNNNVRAFRSLMHLSRCPSLRVLDLRNTPLSMEAEYRSYSLYLLPSLKILDGVEPRQEEKEEIKQVFAGRLTKELLEQIIGKQLPCLEGECPQELLVANNKIDLAAGGLGGVDGPGLTSLPLLELRGNGLSRVEGLGTCCRLEVLDLSDNRIRRIDSEAFQGATETLRCLVIERNGLRSLCGFPFLPNLEELRIAQNRIPDFSQTEYLVQLPKLRQIGFQQNPACQRRQWRSVLAEQLPYLEAIDGEIVSLEEVQRKLPVGTTEGLPAGEDHGPPLAEAPNDETDAAMGTIQQQSPPEYQTLQQQQQLLLCYSAKTSKFRSVVQQKPEAAACGAVPKSKPPPSVPELVALNLGVVGVGAPGISPSSGGGSSLSRRDPPPETSGVKTDI
ncbi:hypothetical protein EBH_0000680 [Eimeria brunetti]|uniref:Leucine rich repeat protein n=1 Tax=Eimeria brunetti TaxID=51314 RepID=U6LM82_9EIME|nr:hypothetical protein EBH_0000680 [Eimeria brunetti]